MTFASRSLGELGEFRNGLNYSKRNFGEGLKVISVKDFGDRWRPDISILDEIDPTGLRISDSDLRAGDILFVRSNGNKELIGRSLLVDRDLENVSFSGFCIRFRPFGTEASPQFLSLYFRTPLFRRTLSLQGKGTNINNLSQPMLKRMQVPWPPKGVREEIAKKVGAYDRLIDNNRRRIALLEEAARLLYREWFVYLRFPGHEHVKIIDGLPEGWQSLSPSELVADHIGGGWGKDNSEGKETESAYVIRGTDIPEIERGNINGVGLRFHGPSNLASRKLSPYDIVFEVSGGSTNQPIARTLILTPERLKQWNGDVICASFCKRFRFRSNEDASFFHFHVREYRDRGDILAYQKESASSLKNFNFEGFMSGYRLMVPPVSLRSIFYEVVSDILRQQAVLSAQTSKLAESRDLLLPRLMSGEIAV